MNDQEVLQRLTGVFREVFEDPTLVCQPAMSAADVAKWDSLTHIDMIMMVESEFRVRLPTFELVGMENVGDLVRMIRAKIH